jgi:hypothetical protein
MVCYRGTKGEYKELVERERERERERDMDRRK